MFRFCKHTLIIIGLLCHSLLCIAGRNPIAINFVSGNTTFPQGASGSANFLVQVDPNVVPLNTPISLRTQNLPNWETQVTRGNSACTGVPICQNPFALSAGQSCCLMLRLNGRYLSAGSQLVLRSQVSGNNGFVGVEAPDVTITVENGAVLGSSIENLGLAASGTARTITITNWGNIAADNLSISYPTWPAGTSATSNCPSSLAAQASCSITITPGSTTTSDCSHQLIAPTAGVVSVSASNVAAPATTNVFVLNYGCIYEQGYLYAIDDSTAVSKSIGGSAVSLSNNSEGIAWWNGTALDTDALSKIDGKENTDAIISAQGSGAYAASVCKDYTIDSAGNSPCASATCYDGWYLPAICQLGVSNIGFCPPPVESILENLRSLINCSSSECFNGIYWSSTQFDTDEANAQYIDEQPHVYYLETYEGVGRLRCVRDLSS